MSYLDSEAVGRLGDMLDEGTPMEVHEEAAQESSPDVSEVKEETQQSDEVSTEPVANTEPVTGVEAGESVRSESEGMSDSGDDSDGSHRVPYNRFKQVIDARNQLRNERDVLAQQIQDLSGQMKSFREATPQAQPKAQMQEQPRQAAYQSGLQAPEFMSDEEIEYFSALQSEFGQRYNSLDSRLQTYEMSMAEKQLDSAIDQAIVQYPDVPRRAILESVASGNTNIMDVAERYQSFVNQMREQAIADYLSENPQAKAAAQVAPRPSRTAGSAPSSSQISSDDKPKNLADAHKALSKFLKTNNIF
tara:strand:- start:232 stop:1143 length:912 start_codon:yes stop_codon:yes gene_type:complete